MTKDTQFKVVTRYGAINIIDTEAGMDNILFSVEIANRSIMDLAYDMFWTGVRFGENRMKLQHKEEKPNTDDFRYFYLDEQSTEPFCTIDLNKWDGNISYIFHTTLRDNYALFVDEGFATEFYHWLKAVKEEKEALE